MTDTALGQAAPLAALPESYGRWRESRLGRITDAIEERLILDLLGPVNGLHILDVGCGDGALASTLARRGAQMTGLDTDPRMLAAAHRRARIDSVELKLVQGQAEAPPFSNGAFDRVIAVTTLCFVAEPERAIAEMARMLKPGGQIIIGELGRWSLWAAVRRIRGWFGSATWRAARFHTSGELRSLLEEYGLTVTETRGAIFYPPCGVAASLLAHFDLWLGRHTTISAAFIALSGIKQAHDAGNEGY